MTSTARSPVKLWMLLAVIVLAAFTATTALPDYVSGSWPWATPLDVPHLKTLRTLRQQGIELPDWQEDMQEVAELGGTPWSVQQFSGKAAGESVQAVLLLRPQTGVSTQPTLEWIDLSGAQDWKIDQQRRLRLTSEMDAPAAFQVRFARAWNAQQTYAIAQWYSWPQGGHPSPNHWFWQDQLSQWRSHQRLPWVAVTVLLPIEPLGASAAAEDTLRATVQTVQTALQTQVFTDTPPAS